MGDAIQKVTWRGAVPFASRGSDIVNGTKEPAIECYRKAFPYFDQAAACNTSGAESLWSVQAVP
jgi:hypothetical protein